MPAVFECLDDIFSSGETFLWVPRVTIIGVMKTEKALFEKIDKWRHELGNTIHAKRCLEFTHR